jgi:hypothetical protein
VFGGLSAEGTAENHGQDLSAVPSALNIIRAGFPAINHRAIVGCSYGTSLREDRDSLLATTDKAT